MKCLVTGGTGHIGSYLVRLLLERGCQVTVLLRPNSNTWRIKEVLNRVNVIIGDLNSVNEMEMYMRSVTPEVAFHLGWDGVGSQTHNSQIQIQNLYGSLNLLQLVTKYGCQRWVYVGSQAEYGSLNGILSEDLPTRPITLYGVTKLSVGLLSQKLCEINNIGFTWLRLLAAYGPMDSPQHLIPSVILSLLSSKKPALTLGEQRWDYLYVKDVVSAIWQSAISPGAKGVFNLSSGQAITVKSIVERVRDLIDPKLPIGFGEMPYRSDQIMHLQADISRLNKATGWLPNVSLDQGLERTVTWYRKNYC